MRTERGMTLLEMLVAMVTFLTVLAGAIGAIRGQMRGFTRGVDEGGILQNLRYGVDQLEQEARVAGANTADRQPAVVYASNFSFSFNADLVSNVAGDISTVYVDPTAPGGSVNTWALADASPVPGSAPSFAYPLADYGLSGAETITFWFELDPETARADDYVLMRQVNGEAPERLMRQVLAPAGGVPFFQYSYLNVPAVGNWIMSPVPAGWLPLRHTAPLHGQLPDTGSIARIDLLRSVTMTYRVTDGRAGAAERIRDIQTTLALPNVGVKKLQTCGSAPIFGQPLVAVLIVDPMTGSKKINVSWAASVDDASGEQDVIRYVIWRQANGAGWGDPNASIPGGAAPYLFTDLGVTSGSSYQYSVAAQDCTPTLSPRSFSPVVVVP